MKKHLSVAGVFAGVVLAAVGLAAQEGGNLLANPSFEMESGAFVGKVPPRWTRATLSKDGVANPPDSKSTATVQAGGRTDKHATVLSLDRGDSWIMIDQRVAEIDIAKGEQYALSAWLRADKPVEVQLYMSAYVPSLKKVYELHTDCKITTKWKRFVTGVTIGPKVGDPTRVSTDTVTTKPYLRCVAQLRTPGIKVAVDDVQLVRVGQGTSGKAPSKAKEPAPREKTPARAEGGPNLLENVSFEEEGEALVGKTPPHWVKGSLSQGGVDGSPDSKSVVAVARGGRTGDYSAQLLLEKTDKWMLLDQRIETEYAKGERYRFSIWLKADKKITANIALAAHCPTLRKVFDRHVECRLTQRWQEFEVTVTIGPKVGDPTHVSALPASAGRYVRCIVQLREAGVTVSADDARLVRTREGTERIKRTPAGEAPEAEETSPPAKRRADREQEVRSEVLLRLPDTWLFRKDRDKVGEREEWFASGEKGAPWRPLTIRTFWPEHMGDGWYALDAEIPSGGEEKVWIVFGAIDENYTLWLNGRLIGDNMEVPGELSWDQVVAEEITGKYKPGEKNHIVVRVNNIAGAGGIWKPVFVVAGPVGSYPESEKPKVLATAKWLEPSDAYETPHIKWEKPSAQGRCKVLFITSRAAMREIVELCQRFDIERETFAFERPGHFSGNVEKGQYSTFTGTDHDAQEERLREKLDLDYDCIVFGNVEWGDLPDWAAKQILDKVAGGTGLVACPKGGATGSLKSAASKKVDVASLDVVGAVPFKGLPAFVEYPSETDFARGTLDVSQHGKGRIVMFTGFDCPNLQMLTPGIMTEFIEYHMVHYDYYVAMAGRAIQWASGRRPGVRVGEGAEAVLAIDREALSEVPFTLGADKGGSVNVAFAMRHAKSGEVVAQANETAALAAGENALGFDVAPVSAGPYFADLWVKQGGKTISSGSIFVEVSSKSRIEGFALTGKGFEAGDRVKDYRQADPITGTIAIKAVRDGLTVEVRQTDVAGRLLARETYGVAASVKFELHPLQARSVLQWIDVKLLDGHTVLDAKRDSFTYNDLHLPEPGEDVFMVLWEGLHGDTYFNEYIYKIAREADFGIVHTAFCFDEKMRSSGALLRANLYEFASLHYASPVRPRIDGDPAPVAPGSARHVRKPCLTDPEVMKTVANTYTKAAQTAGKYSTTHYHLGSESEFTNPHKEQEVCFSPTCIAHFRTYLEEEYDSIDKLNREYGTRHADWSDVEPVDFKTAIQTDQFPLWADFRRSMDTVWANSFSRAKDVINRVVPNAKVGTEASDDPGHQPRKTPGLGGDDWWKLDKAQSLNVPYFVPVQMDVLRDFADPGTVTGTTYGGYSGVFRAERKGDWHRWLAWFGLLRYRSNSIHIWRGSTGQQGAMVGTTVAPDLSWFDFMDESLAALGEIQDGIGKLILAMDRPDDGIAVLYSQASMLMANLSREFPQRWDSLAAVGMVFPESNFQYRFITPEQLAGGLLDEGSFRLLYLPYCQGLSAKEVDRVRAFVKAGGAVLADLRPAVGDEHGKLYTEGALDDVFGVKQDTNTMEAEATVDSVFLQEPVGEVRGKMPQTTTDTTLELAGGKAFASVAEAPAIVVNDYGKGKAMLLNFAPSDYILEKLMLGGHSAIRFADDDAATKTASLLQGLLAKCELTPEVGLDPYVPGCHVYRFAAGDARVLGLLWEIPPYLPGIGDLPMGDLDEISATWSRDVTLALGEEMHVYDTLERKYLGRMKKIPRTVTPGVPHVLAALPYKVEAVSLAPARDSLKQGETLAFSAAVETDGAEAGLHVLRIEFTDPDGKVVKVYTQKLVAESGECSGRVQLSLNEKVGDWRITARDVSSGTSGGATVRVVADR